MDSNKKTVNLCLNVFLDPNYLNRVSSSDLFVVSTMVASKFLFDDGTGELLRKKDKT